MPYQRLDLASRQEWLEERRKGIGGSDVAALFGKSKWTTRTDLIKKKKNPVVVEEQSAITGLGSRMERVIIEDFVLNKYEDVWTTDTTIFTNPKYEGLQASLDAMATIDGEEVIIEIKFVNLFGGTNWKNEDGEWILPEHYWMQVQHYMTVLEKRKAIVVAFMQELNDVLEFPVEHDPMFATSLAFKAKEFLQEVENYTGTLELEVKEPDAPIVQAELGEVKDINNTIKKLTIRKKEIQSRLLNTYDNSVKLEFGNLKGIIYDRKTTKGTTRILKVA